MKLKLHLVESSKERVIEVQTSGNAWRRKRHAAWGYGWLWPMERPSLHGVLSLAGLTAMPILVLGLLHGRKLFCSIVGACLSTCSDSNILLFAVFSYLFPKPVFCFSSRFVAILISVAICVAFCMPAKRHARMQGRCQPGQSVAQRCKTLEKMQTSSQLSLRMWCKKRSCACVFSPKTSTLRWILTSLIFWQSVTVLAGVGWYQKDAL